MNESILSDKVTQYIQDNLLEEDDSLFWLRKVTSRDPGSFMQVSPEQGQFLGFLVKLIHAKKTIDIGTYTGYSSLAVALAMPNDSYTITCDIHPYWIKIAKKYWTAAGVDSKIHFEQIAAIDMLESLVAKGNSNTFDFIFIDADKENYLNYYELSLMLIRQGGLIAIDNTLLFGKVADESIEVDNELVKKYLTKEAIQVVRELNLRIKSDSRVDNVLLPAFDGLALIRKIN